MPEENSRMKELLKAYAKKRQDEAGPSLEMHPATRNLLQGEVARQFSQKDKPVAKPNIIRLLWPRLALAAASVALFAGVLVLFQSKTDKARDYAANAPAETERARGVVWDDDMLKDGSDIGREKRKAGVKDLAGSVSSSVPTPPAKVDAAFDGLTMTNNIVLGEPRFIAGDASAEVEMLQRRAEAQPVPASSTQKFEAFKEASPAAGGRALAKKIELPPEGTAELAAAARPPAVVTSTATVFADAAAPSSAPVAESTPAAAAPAPVQQPVGTLRFALKDSGKYRQNFQSPPQSPVLSSFEVALDGNNVQVIDADGSVYNGQLIAQSADKRPEEAAVERKAQAYNFQRERETAARKPALASTPAQPPQGLQFRAVGTNLQLKQAVVLEGILITNAMQTITATVETRAARTDANVPSKQSPVQTGATIQGKAVVGGKTEFQINAVQTAP